MARRIPTGAGNLESSTVPLSGSIRLRLQPGRDTTCPDDGAPGLGTVEWLEANALRDEPQINAAARNRRVRPVCRAGNRAERSQLKTVRFAAVRSIVVPRA